VKKISLKEARRLGRSRYYTGVPCVRGHICARITTSALCCECSKMHKRNAHYKKAGDPEYKRKRKEYTERNKDSKKEYDKRYRKDNREKVNKNSREWTKNNKSKRSAISQNYKAKRRAIKKEGMSSIELMEWKKSQQKVCHWCQVECEESFHVDHYIPLSKGGKHIASNLVISCASCNVRKNNKMPDIWEKEIREMIA